MTIVKSPFLSELRKSMGNITFCRFRGKNILKEKIKNNHSCTLPQRRQRMKMKTLIELSLVFDSVDIGFPDRKNAQTVANAFIRANKNAVTVSKELGVTIHYERIVCSQGKRKTMTVEMKLNEESHEMTFIHEAGEYGRYADKTDVLYAVLLEKGRQHTKLFSLNRREDGSPITVTYPAGWHPENFVVYVFMLSENRRKASLTDCIYSGLQGME